MKNAIRLGTLSIAALVMGCIPLSLHPLYTEETQEFDPNLIGAWVALDGDSETADGWFIVSADKATYRVVIREEGKANPMNGRLVRIGESLFLDLFPAEVDLGDASQPGLKLGDYYRMQLLSLHTFVRVDAIEPALRLRAANHKALEQIINETPEAIQHQPMSDDDDWFFFTAPPEELQAFVAKYEKTLFEREETEPMVFKRRPTKALDQK